ncbi:MAG: hypothetical protein MIL41_06635 [Hyphomicrobiales bacterium]|jgi:predicted secreted protein
MRYCNELSIKNNDHDVQGHLTELFGRYAKLAALAADDWSSEWRGDHVILRFRRKADQKRHAKMFKHVHAIYVGMLRLSGPLYYEERAYVD